MHGCLPKTPISEPMGVSTGVSMGVHTDVHTDGSMDVSIVLIGCVWLIVSKDASKDVVLVRIE